MFQAFNSVKVTIGTFVAVVMAKTSMIETQRLQQELEESLTFLDKQWSKYEKVYINELMVIESDARRLIVSAITQYQLISSLEGKLKGKKDLRQARSSLIGLFCKINSVANTQGKGRDDFTLSILTKAEELIHQPPITQAVTRISQWIMESFQGLCHLLKQYSSNIEIVDPQLKNNPDLVQALCNFEVAWGLGKEFLVDHRSLGRLQAVSMLIEETAASAKQFSELVECRASDVFMIIPSLVVFKAVA